MLFLNIEKWHVRALMGKSPPAPMPRITRQKIKVPTNDKVGPWPAMAEKIVPIATIINSTPNICNQSIHIRIDTTY